MSHRPLIAFAACGLALSLAGCGGSSKGSEGKPSSGGGGGGPTASAPARVELNDGAGKLLFKLERSENGYTVDDDAGNKLASVKLESDRAKLKDADAKPTYKIKQKGTGFKLYREPAVQGGADVELFDFAMDGGELKIKDASDRFLYKGKPKENKLKVQGPTGQFYDVKSKPDGVEVEDSSGKRLIRLKGVSSPAAAVVCAAPEFDMLQKAVVVAYSAGVAR